MIDSQVMIIIHSSSVFIIKDHYSFCSTDREVLHRQNPLSWSIKLKIDNITDQYRA